MKKYWKDSLGIFGIVFIVLVFFYKTITSGLLPVPTDTLIGMYHPWRDMYAKEFPNGIPFKNFLITDPIRQQIPWRKQVIDAIKEKRLPLWDATSFSGTPLLANIQSGAFYPLNIMFFLLPFSIAWTLLIISQPLLAGIFLYLFLRHRHLGVLSSLVGSVCFAFSGFSTSWLTWGTIGSTILWLPLAIFSFEKIHESTKKNIWRLVFVFSVVSSFFAGHIQIFAYCMLVLGIYALWTYRKMRMQKVSLMHIVIPIAIIAVTAPVWLRLLAYLPDTSRIAGSSWMAEGFFIPFRHLIQFVAPDFFGNPATLNYWGTWNYGEMVGYIGVVGIFLAIVGISKESAVWAGIVCIALLFAVDSPVARLPFLFHVPGISSLQPTRLLSLVDLGLSVLSAYGMASLVCGVKRKQISIAITLLFIIFVCAWISVLIPASFGVPMEQIAVVKRNLILPSAVFVVLLFGIVGTQKFRHIGTFSLLILLSFELVRFGWKFTPFTDASYFFPKTGIISQLQGFSKPFRVVSVDDRLLPANVLSYYDIESISGYDPIYSLRYEEYIAAMERGEPNIKPPFGFNRIIAPKTITSPLLSLLNVHYILSMDPLVGSNIQLVFEEGTTKLYTYGRDIPRVYLADQIITEVSKEAVIRQLYEPTFIPGRTAVLESPIAIQSLPLGTSESAKIVQYEGDRMIIATTTKSPRLLVIGNMMDSHWKVTIDGMETSILRVNYLFFGIVVPDGDHTVTVQYK
jgi:hypothetical protein